VQHTIQQQQQLTFSNSFSRTTRLSLGLRPASITKRSTAHGNYRHSYSYCFRFGKHAADQKAAD
jgi:hypothetical protein